MGIRFFCPNGHKLNVKEHLAGRAGFCPECGVRLVIPYQSTRKSSRELLQEKSRGEPSLGVPAVSMESSPFFSGEHQQSATVDAETPVPVASPAAIEQPTNPILLDQAVAWYIQVPNGPQYGPATGQVVSTWIQEGRIGPTMLVWREGWADWLEAQNVFSEWE